MVLAEFGRYLFGSISIAAAEILFILVIIYIFKMRNTFSSLPRLEKPWMVLEGGVALLFLGVLLIAVKDVMGVSMGHMEEFDDGIIAISAVFILASLMMMKRAWTVTERE